MTQGRQRVSYPRPTAGRSTAPVWAYRYCDGVHSDAAETAPIDVLSAGALHPGLYRTDLAYFWDRAEHLMNWLEPLPADLSLRDATTR